MKLLITLILPFLIFTSFNVHSGPINFENADSEAIFDPDSAYNYRAQHKSITNVTMNGTATLSGDFDFTLFLSVRHVLIEQFPSLYLRVDDFSIDSNILSWDFNFFDNSNGVYDLDRNQILFPNTMYEFTPVLFANGTGQLSNVSTAVETVRPQVSDCVVENNRTISCNGFEGFSTLIQEPSNTARVEFEESVSVPEPSSMALMILAFLGLLGRKFRASHG